MTKDQIINDEIYSLVLCIYDTKKKLIEFEFSYLSELNMLKKFKEDGDNSDYLLNRLSELELEQNNLISYINF